MTASQRPGDSPHLKLNAMLSASEGTFSLADREGEGWVETPGVAFF